MYHSITLGTKNAWDDWHLIPKSRPLVNPPEVKTNYVEIPGSDSVLDLTTVLSGRPLYKNRSSSWEVRRERNERKQICHHFWYRIRFGAHEKPDAMRPAG